MALESEQLRQLVRAMLKMDGLGPALRRAARKALTLQDPARLRAVGRSIAAELLRRGALVRVVTDSPTAGDRPLCMVRSSGRLLDLSALQNDRGAQKTDSGSASRLSAEPGSSLQAPARVRSGGTMPFDQVLEAMEGAQNLKIGDPLSGERHVIITGILQLLSRFLPDQWLCVLLQGEAAEQQSNPYLRHIGEQRQAPLWQISRTSGSTIWISQWFELPGEVRQALGAQMRAGATGDAGFKERFKGSVAVPLYEPQLTGVATGDRPREVGLLFLASGAEMPKGTLIRLGRRLSGFVSRRWQHQHEVNQRIHTDSLTGIRNRAFFDSQFALELERGKRQNGSLALVLCDLDHFKRINDEHGHQAGDAVLCAVARELQRGLRRIDHVCRIGGEEFALVLPDTRIVAVREAVSRLMARLNSLTIDLPDTGKTCSVTLSFGVVTYPEGGDDAVDLYRKADAMLYRSKRTGRNRCSIWSGEDEPQTLLPPTGDQD